MTPTQHRLERSSQLVDLLWLEDHHQHRHRQRAIVDKWIARGDHTCTHSRAIFAPHHTGCLPIVGTCGVCFACGGHSSRSWQVRRVFLGTCDQGSIGMLLEGYGRCAEVLVREFGVLAMEGAKMVEIPSRVWGLHSHFRSRLEEASEGCLLFRHVVLFNPKVERSAFWAQVISGGTV